jgi:hypothetical protein
MPDKMVAHRNNTEMQQHQRNWLRMAGAAARWRESEAAGAAATSAAARQLLRRVLRGRPRPHVFIRAFFLVWFFFWGGASLSARQRSAPPPKKPRTHVFFWGTGAASPHQGDWVRGAADHRRGRTPTPPTPIPAVALILYRTFFSKKSLPAGLDLWSLRRPGR